MTTSEPQPEYGQSTAWQPDRPSVKLFPLIVSWFATGVALMVASWALPGVDIGSFWGALVVAAVVALLNAVIPPVLAALRLPLTLVLGFLLVLIADALILQIAAELQRDRWRLQRRQLRLGTPRRVHRRRCECRSRRSPRIRQHGVDPHGAADREAAGDHRLDRRARDRLSRDRRARAAGAASRDAGRECAEHGPLGAGHTRSRRVGDGSLVADGGEPGGDPAGLERGHLGVPLGGEGDGDDDDLLGAARLRRARAAARHRDRSARQRRRQPRQPALRRGGRRDPHRQPDGCGEEVEPRLPRLLRQRRQRHPHARPVRLGGHPRVDGRPPCDPPGRAAPRPPRRASTR